MLSVEKNDLCRLSRLCCSRSSSRCEGRLKPKLRAETDSSVPGPGAVRYRYAEIPPVLWNGGNQELVAVSFVQVLTT